LDKRVDAIVFDAPVLQHYAADQGTGRVHVVGPVFYAEDYAYVFTNGSALRKPVDAALLTMREDGAYNALAEKWFGKK
jgi:polar amino acid transport system substrate-binding protein